MVHNLMSNAEWAFFEPFVSLKWPKSGHPWQAMEVFLTEFSGLHEVANLGVICLNISANVDRFRLRP